MSFILSVLFATLVAADSPLKPAKLDTPRATFSSYLEAIEGYKKGLKTNDPKLKSRLYDAQRCFDFSELPALTKNQEAKKATLLLKEVIDRVISVDLSKIPDDEEVQRWRLKDTEITIRKMKEGDREGLYLFSANTVERLPDFYDRVKNLPYLDVTTKGAGYKDQFFVRIFPSWAQGKVGGVFHWQWLGLLISLFLGWLIKYIVEHLVDFAKYLAAKKKGSVRRELIIALEGPIGLLAATGFWYFCVHQLRFEGTLLTVLLFVLQLLISFNVIWTLYRLTDLFTRGMERAAKKTDTELDDQLVPLVRKSLRVFIVVLGVLATIQNLGYNVMSLMAGLGLGGLAFALAARDTAANLFGSIMILLDHPFKVGEWIKAGDVEGTVEEIGFRSTRIRTFYKSEVSVPNSILANQNIDNMGRRDFRRVYTTLGVTYDTSTERLQAFIDGIQEIIRNNLKTHKEDYYVYFSAYGDFNLQIMVYFFLAAGTWQEELEGKQNIYMEIYNLAENLGVEFAFPTQTIHLNQNSPQK